MTSPPKPLTREEKREIWVKIQTQSPDTAKFLEAFNEVFGKPQETHIWINGEKIL